MDAFLGQIIMFAGNYAPDGWAVCDGSKLPIQDYEALFALLGTAFGGDGRTNFALPDLRGRLAIGVGQGTTPGATDHPLAQAAGSPTVSLTAENLPPHNHVLYASQNQGGQSSPATHVLGKVPSPYILYYNPNSTEVTATKFGPAAIQSVGQGTAHSNMMPCLGITYLMCTQGLFPNFG